MLRPTLDEAKSMAPGYTVLPVSREIYADIKTPIALLKAINTISHQYYLLESVEGGEVWGRYSFLGFDPITQINCKDHKMEIDNGTIIKLEGHNPTTVIREILAQYKTPRFDFLPPFTGGFVGYFAYDFIKYYETTLQPQSRDEANFNDLELMLFDKVIAYDHLKQKIIIIINIKTDALEEGYRKASYEIDNIIKLIKQTVSEEANKPVLKSELHSDTSKHRFEEMVRKAKEHIYNGDVFQVVLSRLFTAQMEGSLMDTYRVLRTTNPSPYMFFIKTKDVEIAGTSPETLVKLQNGNLSTYPLAGTRERGKDEIEDKLIEEELMQDEKELSEHNMLVDLGRNDLGRISQFGSVKVKDYLKILRFSHVMHIASEVNSEIRNDKDALDAIMSVLPAGTLSGAPKIRACEIIDDLEETRRGIYGGAVGYIDFSGNMDTCIAIRMAVKKEDRVYVQAGAGIVADSVPENEYIECQNKAMAVIRALKLSQEEMD
ncbi:anthranilate synthase component I [Desulfosporosinus orientis DSM 765]|uniref:Anthranilate synthase component 1 n=1 Tax=Desulfosporosinus orientis (strain ATCC 19365 / DSM 765 / NCIMB 8382 / VKM B-1628 / Singapore I) TaxID=768706 RepID=G7WAQ8_DESOD|nr:anthranilate synthase component I [Desulfosporosinus orientis]AET67119.1 anthranilate synthase component I [Desulfosporosinus orientis DSM 765]